MLERAEAVSNDEWWEEKKRCREQQAPDDPEALDEDVRVLADAVLIIHLDAFDLRLR